MKKIVLLLSVIANFMGQSFCLDEKPMVVIVPSYNNAQWCYQNISSILEQKYDNYRVVYIDDCSQDNTAEIVDNLVKTYGQEHRFTLIRNKRRCGALANLYYAIHACADDEIIVTVDGDDWLKHQGVLAKLNEAYATQDIWLTHGRFVETLSGWDGWCIEVPHNVVKKNAFRTYRCPSHLRTFYAWLFKKIKKEDLMHEGKFFSMAWDQAMLFPMFEMAGERHAFMNEVLYVYNTTTPINDNKVNPELQRKLEYIIRNKPRYRLLPSM